MTGRQEVGTPPVPKAGGAFVPRPRPLPSPPVGGDLALLAFALVLLAGLTLVSLLPGPRGLPDEGEAAAAATMRKAMGVLGAELSARGHEIDPAADPNRSGLVGLPWSGITTTLGSLPAKRSAAQPAAAALLRRLLVEAGVRKGDLVAIDSSGSFPGFAVASLLAAEGLGARNLILASVGSSTWGANRPDFALPDILSALARARLISHGPDAVSAGGGEDAGQGMDADELAAIIARARGGGALLLGGGGLDEDVAARLAFIAEKSGGRPPALLVSIGGNLASTGEGDPLAGKSGLLLPRDFGQGGGPGRGLVQAFLARGLPVIRLIDVKELAATTGLPYDPLPWPEGAGLGPPRTKPRPLLSVGLVGLAFLTAIVLRRAAARRLPGRREGRRAEPRAGRQQT